jgi:hypothetical protein
MSSLPAAKLSLSIPQSPLGSAAVTAMPAIITLSRSSFHSSGEKFDLSVMGVTPYLRPVSAGRLEVCIIRSTNPYFKSAERAGDFVIVVAHPFLSKLPPVNRVSDIFHAEGC